MTALNPYESRDAAWRGGSRDYVVGGAGVAMAASFAGFGAAARDVGLALWQSVLATAGMVFVPSQMIMADLSRSGAGMLTLIVAVAFVSLRLFPMALALMPLLREGRDEKLRFYLVGHTMATTSWAYAMKRCPTLPADQRLAYFSGAAVTNYGVILVATAAGYLLADAIDPLVTAGLVLFAPLYFLLLFLADVTELAGRVALAAGAVLGPVLYQFEREWSLLATGLVGGTVAFAVHRARSARGD
ncbi:MAG: AzlC family ABC transporter permease [Rhodospirillales bacterium]